MVKTKIQPVKGTRDFYPEDIAFQNWLFGRIRTISESFGYQEYDGPILEPIELYLAKTSEELIKQQAFTLKDGKGRELVLRPEMTPSVARMVAAKSYELPIPARLFNIGPRFRYEAPQRGRLREFYQWDVDMFGANTPEADAEIIAVAAEFFKTLGLTPDDVVIKINDRSLIETKFAFLDIPEDKWLELTTIIDRREKLTPKAWQESLAKLDFSDKQISELETVLRDTDFSFESENLTRIFSTLEDLGYRDYVEFDPSIVRGLLYYSSTVFETKDRHGEFRSLLGGGRYASLVGEYGGRDLSGVGFATSDIIIQEFLAHHNKLPELKAKVADVLVVVVEEGAVRDALKISTSLRSAQINTEFYPDATVKLDKQLSFADKKGIPFVVIFGKDEMEKQVVTVKKMATGAQKQILLKNLTHETVVGW
ncbi:histidine--tRNA ligase [Candidatus Roizmanbacteria bacterium CG22_combo_CG10-13_8_21_14_all_38_20]|uniref:Histidine--tRNA ligase n=1 Tax=Candidatus Roizmanbacteria bacterium CG22_combo_CG10-13_8_21_14_all_38_20 TaxID=1974862 RepID=A0A2H0BUC7_9BACT|nr:histidine--tRNA ligase [Candidatus Microgenomates bacterium]PIP61296.1 MAG: histidine--tRNA ligase [Candidatus Roizmanbacteria bacterium CG22_combo_CG10-13_8_21_14_all_38_20]PJC30632.1 MAG: histidine--tRNA ligase [Candidatus Roizmanbacteria bacterium CG_4_9_14_0_2_um_filter_38_17]